MILGNFSPHLPFGGLPTHMANRAPNKLKLLLILRIAPTFLHNAALDLS